MISEHSKLVASPFWSHPEFIWEGRPAPRQVLYVVLQVRCHNLAPACGSHANANSGPRKHFGEWLSCSISLHFCNLLAHALVPSPRMDRSDGTLTRQLRGQGGGAFRFRHLTQTCTYRIEALCELRVMRCRADACHARFACALRASPAFRP